MSNILLAREEAGLTWPGWKPIQVQVSKIRVFELIILREWEKENKLWIMTSKNFW